jgi:hypothetical protein
MEGAEQVCGDGDVVVCGGRVNWDDGHSVFIVSQGRDDLVLPDGPATRGAATSWRVYRFGRDDFLWPSPWSGMIVLIAITHRSSSIEVWNVLIFW